MSEPVVITSIEDGIATVTLNRPEKLNALNRELRGEFCRVMQRLRTDKNAGVVIITGAGRAFCAGLDLRELGSSGIREEGNATFITVVEDMEVPVIAAVNGFAVTGGFELALACDRMSARLPRAVGIRKARELSLTGNYLGAREAERIGLVNRVVPREQLLETAKELAAHILGANQKIVRQMKRLYDLTSRASLHDGLRIEQDFFRAFNSAAKFDDFDQRREAVMERGRSQTGAKRDS
jgi:enoyl-CoA hydratase